VENVLENTHAEPTHATGRVCHTVQSCSAQARQIFEGFSRPRSCAAPPAAAAAVRKNGMDLLHAPASPTGAPIFLSRHQYPRRLGKNQGYKTSPRSAVAADGEANTGTRTADTHRPID